MSAAIVDSGVANLAAVTAALASLGTESHITGEPRDVLSAEHVVLPGVGAFGAAMQRLAATGLADALRRRVIEQRPLLAICLGMQLMAEASDESPDVPGLGIVPGRCRRLAAGVRLPHLGWNRVAPNADCRWLEPATVAFANSYCLEAAPEGWAAAWTDYGGPFVAGLERGRVLACQFHPELSGKPGLALIDRWLADKPADRAERGTRADGFVQRIVPCLDVRDGRVVKGIRFQGLRDSGDPAERAALYAAQGADEIVVLDIGATPEARENQIDTVRRIRAGVHIPLIVGGGVRSVDDARRLLTAGADKLSVNSAAVRRPSFLTELAEAFGTQCVLLAIDARRAGASWETLVNGGRESADIDAIEWAERGAALGAGEILLTSWDRDGTREGCDLTLIARVAAAVSVPVIASGGIGSREDIAAAFDAGANAVLAASILHDDEERVDTIKDWLWDEGFAVRR